MGLLLVGLICLPALAENVIPLFNQSIWWDFIQESQGKNLRLFPQDVTADGRTDVVAVFELQRQATVEPVVRILTFAHQGGFDFQLLNTAEPIPGRVVEAQLRTDLTSRARPQLVLLTERGGISLLRSLLVLEYQGARPGFVPLLSVTDLSNARIRVSRAGILVSTGQPGSLEGRATLYQWQGNDFARIEL
ncbi:MAG: hypothetical protein Q6L60_03365 [Thermostichus sp. HHBFW_bins_43]